jgi:hypothetical protein
MKHDIGLNKILGTIHVYPTYAESNKYAAGIWKRSTATRGKLELAKALNDWQRGEVGFGAVLGKVYGFYADKRRYYEVAESHGHD